MKRLVDVTNGVSTWYHGIENGKVTVSMTQDVEPIIEAAKRLANRDNGVTKDKSMKRVGSIPPSIQLKWAQEAGVNIFQLPAKERLEFFKRKLREREWSHLRTSSGSF